MRPPLKKYNYCIKTFNSSDKYCTILVLFLILNMQTTPRRIVLVRWKKLDDYIEIYSSLKDFCDCHPDFKYYTVNNYLSKKKVPFENAEVKVERKPFVKEARKPAVRNSLFWEFDLDRMDWMRSYRTVIERVLELG